MNSEDAKTRSVITVTRLNWRTGEPQTYTRIARTLRRSRFTSSRLRAVAVNPP